MTYEESWPKEITLNELKRELKRHSRDTAEFLTEYNLEVQPFYDSEQILACLGY